MKKAVRLIAAFQVLVLLVWTTGKVRAQTANEFEVKAAFLYKFASFVEWPPDSSNGPMCIAVVGQDPFGSMLDEVVKGKSIGGRGFSIRRIKGGQDVSDCHIVFISLSERARVRSILERLRATNALTVSDIPGFCTDGGMIGFELLDQKIRFEINAESAERAHLKVSSKLLSVAINVRQRSR